MSAIEHEIEQLDRLILASEDWAKQYKKTPDALAKLIKTEAKLARVVRKYFRDFANDRVVHYINWQLYQVQQVKAYNLNVIVDATEIDDFEYNEFLNVVHNPLLTTIALGAQTAETTYNIDLGLNQYSDAVMKAAQNYTAHLVQGITSTTKDRIQQSIATSLHLGEDTPTAIARMRAIINDPTRAEMITRTETVRAYNEGIRTFGRESNATRFYWELSSDPCGICLSEFSDNGGADGVEFDRAGDPPPAHPNCRCGSSLEHDYSSSDNNTDE